jgi:hypothetical protein
VIMGGDFVYEKNTVCVGSGFLSNFSFCRHGPESQSAALLSMSARTLLFCSSGCALATRS